MGGIFLDTPLAEIHGIGPRFVVRLAQLKIRTVGELLLHFPSRYEDFSQIYPIAELEPGQEATIQGTIESIDTRRSWRRGMTITEAVITDETGSIRAVWFNQPYVENVLRPGRLANFSGKVTVSDDELSMSHPIHELISSREAQETRHTGRLVPIYPETRGLTSKGIRFLVQPLLKAVTFPDEWMPQEILSSRGFPSLEKAFRDVHFPAQIEDAERAKERFSFEELFLLQLLKLSEKIASQQERAPQIPIDIEAVKNIIEELPFVLTVSQKTSLWEILKDLEKPYPMQRLLQGDVGSGKTVVVAVAALLAARAGFQTAFMAPTDLLAHQHYETFKKLFASVSAEHQPSIALLTGGGASAYYENDMESPLSKDDCKKQVAKGAIRILLGTHALIEKTVRFKKLALVVVDEQHRFGVRQRAQLADHVSGSRARESALAPHFLSLSATPIPRTLTLTVFGDLDLSLITELPAGRKPILTKTVAPLNREKAYAFIRGQIKKGRQAFVICPRIDPPQNGAEQTRKNAEKFQHRSAFVPRSSALPWDTKAVKEEYEKLSKKIFPDLRVGMLHGQMPARGGSASGGKASKEDVMNAFHERKIDVLVSTSVIEVGVDVPNASIMMIEGADRFGLAQLYQLRGRVGRGAHQSFCFLFTDSPARSTAERLKAIVEAKNGFELAEKDLAIRGPGEFLGQKQAGIPDIAMRGLTNPELVKSTREAAVGILTKDPTLRTHPALEAQLDALRKKFHSE